MSFEIPGLDITLKSSGDMSSYQYCGVRASTTNAAGGCILVATRGSLVTGVWQGNSTAAEYGKVRVLGVSKMQAGDSTDMDTAITQGCDLYCSTVGHAVPSTGSGLHCIGFALESLSTGSTGIIAVLVHPHLST